MQSFTKSIRLFSSAVSKVFFFLLFQHYRILGINHIAIGAPEKSSLQKLWTETLGLTYIKTFKSERENVDEDVLRCGKGPLAVEVDIMQPVDANKKPLVNKPPLNHLGLWVDDIKLAVKEMSAAGVRFDGKGIRPGAMGYDIAFIHPKGNETSPVGGCGVLIELVQAPPEVIAAFDKLEQSFDQFFYWVFAFFLDLCEIY